MKGSSCDPQTDPVVLRRPVVTRRCGEPYPDGHDLGLPSDPRDSRAVVGLRGDDSRARSAVTVPCIRLLVGIPIRGIEGGHDLRLKVLVSRIDSFIQDSDDDIGSAGCQIPSIGSLDVRASITLPGGAVCPGVLQRPLTRKVGVVRFRVRPQELH